MPFDSSAYGPDAAAILGLDGHGERPMVLADPSCASLEARSRIAAAPLPELLRAGLYLYFGCWSEAHETAQAIATPEGSYWHAIVHRQEPDRGNAAWWFGQVGRHAIFDKLGALDIEAALAPWNPLAFLDYCERARRQPGSDLETRARRIQQAEWQILFDYCARLKPG